MFKVYDINNSLEVQVYDVSKQIGKSPKFLVYGKSGWQYEDSEKYCPIEYAKEALKKEMVFELYCEDSLSAEFTLDSINTVSESILNYYNYDPIQMADDNLIKQALSQRLNSFNKLDVGRSIDIGDAFKVVRVS